MDDWAKDALHHLLSMTAFFECDDDRLTINVSGTHYEINVSDLCNFPDTVLGDPLKRVRYLVPGTNDYFLPRHSSSFESILYYYINDGVLVKSEAIPPLIFYQEIRFFQLNEKLIEAYYKDYLSVDEDNPNEPNCWWKKILYQTFYHPPVTYLNSLFSIVSAVINALAAYLLFLETMHIYRNSMWIVAHSSKLLNHTDVSRCSDIDMSGFKSKHAILELLCVTWSV